MSSPLVIRRKSAKEPSIFDTCLAAQQSSSNIVVYSALASQIVTVAWPSYRGIKIKPSGIKDWLRARGLHWACFCGMTAAPGVHLSSQIVQAASGGNVLVFCHYEPTTCRFFLNLTDIFESATRTNEYPLLQKNAQLHGAMHDNGALELINLQLGQLVASNIAPYLKNYCGDAVPGVEQLSGQRSVFRSASTTFRRQTRTLVPTVPTGSAPIPTTGSAANASSAGAGPSNLNNLRASQLSDQRQILRRLAKGEGIEWLEWDGVVETCD